MTFAPNPRVDRRHEPGGRGHWLRGVPLIFGETAERVTRPVIVGQGSTGGPGATLC